MNKTKIPDWVVYPQEKWSRLHPLKLVLMRRNSTRLLIIPKLKARWEGEVHKEKEWGAILTRGGYLVRVWGDPTYKYQTASVGKAFSRALVGLAVEAGLIQPDDVIWETWTGRNQLSQPHKHLDRQYHRTLTWNHLIGPKDGKVHYGGFPVTNGFYWRRAAYAHSKTSWGQGFYAPSNSAVDKGSSIPKWAKWTGDPFYDNYAHAEPGTVGIYSSRRYVAPQSGTDGSLGPGPQAGVR